VCCKCHERTCAKVPLAGWDVALVPEGQLEPEAKGICLLEANLSCNFFRGEFDQAGYFAFLEKYFLDMDRVRFGAASASGAVADEEASLIGGSRSKAD